MKRRETYNLNVYNHYTIKTLYLNNWQYEHRDLFGLDRSVDTIRGFHDLITYIRTLFYIYI